MRYYFVWLSLLCIFMFILQSAVNGFTDSLVLNQQSWQEIWRFVTSILLHGSFTHLLFNLFALLLFGFIAEKIIGSNKFLLLFFSSGIIANLISVNFYESALGASGAIFGIIGVLTVLRPLMPVFVFSIPMPMIIASVIWAGIDIIGIFNPSEAGNIAHLSGLGAGLIIGIILWRKYREKKQKKEKIWIDDREIKRLERKIMD